MKETLVRISDIIDSRRIDVAYFNNSIGIKDFVSLSQYVSVKGGKRIPKGKSFASEHTDYLYLRLSEITDFERIDYSAFKCIDEELFGILKRYEIHDNQIVFSIAGTIGKVFVLKDVPSDKRIILTENCAMIQPKNDSILPEYISILLNCSIVQKQIGQNRIQTTIPKMGLDRIAKLKVPAIPSVSFQQRIIDIYSKAQQARFQKIIESHKTLNDINYLILDRLGISLPSYCTQLFYKINIHSLLANRFDTYYHQPYFDRAFANLKNSKYKVKSLREISSLITSGTTPKSGGKDYCSQEEGIAFIRSGDIDISGDIDFDNLLYITKNIHNTKMKSSKVFKNDIMIAIVGATIGQVGIYLSDDEANINQAIALVRLRDGYNPEYIKEVLKSSIGQLNLDWLKRPVARANINLDEIASIMLPIPSLDEQNDLVNRIKKIRSIAKQLQKEGDALLEEAKQKIEKMIIG